MTNFLERSFEVRVDMLSTLLGLFSLLLLLGRRFVFAGVLCGLCFFFSQKGVYYILSTEAALAAWVIVKRDRSSLGDAVRLNLAMLAVLAAYMGAWSVLSSLSSVSFATFVTPRFVAFTDIYDNLNYYWLQTLSRNPFFYAIALVHLLQLGYWQAARGGAFAIASCCPIPLRCSLCVCGTSSPGPISSSCWRRRCSCCTSAFTTDSCPRCGMANSWCYCCSW